MTEDTRPKTAQVAGASLPRSLAVAAAVSAGLGQTPKAIPRPLAEALAAFLGPHGLKIKSGSASKYQPHQGPRELARRRRRLAQSSTDDRDV